MNKKDAQRTLSIYNLFIRETDSLIGLYDVGNRFIPKLPIVNRVDAGIVSSMEQYITGGSEHDEDKTEKSNESESSQDHKQAHLQTYQAHFETAVAPCSQDSSEEDDEPDPFVDSYSQGTSNPFTTSNLNHPVVPASFHQYTAPIVPDPCVSGYSGSVTTPTNPFITYTQTTTTINNPFIGSNVTAAASYVHQVMCSSFLTLKSLPYSVPCIPFSNHRLRRPC